MNVADLEAGRRRLAPAPLIFPPVRECIYCGSTERLTREHIVPLGLGGQHVLPKSSCLKCAAITGAIERDCLRKILGDLRSSFVIKRRKRKPKNEYKPRPMFANIGRRLVPYSAPEAKHRFNLTFLYSFYEPTILAGVTPVERRHKPFEGIWGHGRLGSEAQKTLQAAAGPTATRVYSIASFHPVIFSKMIGKIGYAFAMANARGRFKTNYRGCNYW